MGSLRTVRSTSVRGGVAVVAVAGATLISGCGATRTVSQAIDPVARAADVTSKVQGYKMAANMTVGTPSGQFKATITGLIDRANRTGQMTAQETIAGHALKISERFSGLTFYMNAAGLPGADQITHGKKWLKMDMTRTLGAMGLGSISTTSTDPSQFVDYLRAVSANTQKLGTDSIRGVSATHYHALVDLNRYPNFLPESKRASARQGVATLEKILGGHTMAMDVWIDGQKLVRRVKFGYPECVNNQKLTFSMTMDLFAYGPQPSTQVPSDSAAYDLTPLVTAAMKNIKVGCSTGSTS
jgi:hypothetical protein